MNKRAVIVFASAVGVLASAIAIRRLLQDEATRKKLTEAWKKAESLPKRLQDKSE